jgi:hypothetical protein
MLTLATYHRQENRMDSTIARPEHPFAALWRASPPLVAAALLLLAVFGASLAGLWLDARVITGAPAWLKPAKFAGSTTVYALTLAWMLTCLPEWPRLRRFAGWATATVFVLEVGLIDVQAWRGTTSHFNIGTPIDAVVFGVMGGAILFQTGVAAAVAVALWRQPFADRAMGWAFRLGLSISVAGALTGGLMTRPTAIQLADARTTGRLAVSGAHTVGAIDGGPGMTGTGWSRQHGDMRVPHFLGLHAMQALPLFALALAWRNISNRVAARLIVVAAASYAVLFALLLWQALRGLPVIAPDGPTTTALVLWLIATVTGAWAVTTTRSLRRTHVIAS